jgi:hypothetical protein
MADSGIKKATMLKADLPPVNSDNKYAVRFRVVSDDRNRASHWSQTYFISAPDVIEVDGDVNVFGSSILVVWDDAANRPKYDIFVKFDTDVDYYYHGTPSVHNYSFVKKTGASSVSVIVQVESVDKVVSQPLTVYSQTEISLL